MSILDRLRAPLPPQIGPVSIGMGRVWIKNDAKTPMQFVVDLLKTEFKMRESDAVRLMLRAHSDGAVACGDHPRDVAQAHVDWMMARAYVAGHPLICTIETE